LAFSTVIGGYFAIKSSKSISIISGGNYKNKKIYYFTSPAKPMKAIDNKPAIIK